MTQEPKRAYAPNEKAGYMSQLEEWISEQVIEPLCHTFTSGDEDAAVIENVFKAIKAKMLESYRNGQNAPVQKPYQAQEKPSNRPAFRQKGTRGYVAAKR